MSEKIARWLEANSPINPVLSIALISIAVFLLVHGKNLGRWSELPGYVKTNIIVVVFAIITLIVVGIDLSLNPRQ